jgi:hypothetical protein
MNIPLTLRLIKGSKLTFAELDQNFINLRSAINTKITTPTNPSPGDTLVWNGTEWVADGESTFTLSLDANQLKTLNSNPILQNILPSGGCISSEMFIRFNTGTQEFNFPGNILLSFGTTSKVISVATVNNLVTIAASKVGTTALFIKVDWTKDVDIANGLIPDGRTFMFKALVGDATLGDSTVDIVVKYRTIEFD